MIPACRDPNPAHVDGMPFGWLPLLGLARGARCVFFAHVLRLLAGGILRTCLRLTRRSKLTSAFVAHSSQDQTLQLDVYECECHMTKFKVSSSTWCAAGRGTLEGHRQRTFEAVKPAPDDRTPPTLNPLMTRLHGFRVLSGRTISTTIRYDSARDRCGWGVAWRRQTDLPVRTVFSRTV